MDGVLPNKELLIAEAADGKPITQSAASAIAAAESDMTSRGPIKGGPAATAQSIHDRQENFLAMAGDIARKPVEELTKEDVAKVQRFEVCTFFELCDGLFE
jgi:Seed maturation protein